MMAYAKISNIMQMLTLEVFIALIVREPFRLYRTGFPRSRPCPQPLHGNFEKLSKSLNFDRTLGRYHYPPLYTFYSLCCVLAEATANPERSCLSQGWLASLSNPLAWPSLCGLACFSHIFWQIFTASVGHFLLLSTFGKVVNSGSEKINPVANIPC